MADEKEMHFLNTTCSIASAAVIILMYDMTNYPKH